MPTRKNKAQGLNVVWFKRDLRVTDHRPLAEAAAAGAVVPLYIIEPEIWRQADAAGRHWAFVSECLAELNDDLGALGQELVVAIGEAIDVLSAIHDKSGIAGLYSHEETGNGWTYRRDLAVSEWCRAAGVPWHEARQSGVVRRLATRDGWAKRWDRQMSESVTAPPSALRPLPLDLPGRVRIPQIPSARELGLGDDPCPQRQPGGRAAAMRCLRTFLEERGEPYRRAMSSPREGAVACSRISPHLAFGTLAMREVVHATRARQRELKQGAQNGKNVGRWRGALVSFAGRLHWRDHFMQKLEDQPSLEFENLHRGYDGLRPTTPDSERLEAWRRGETGWPFVDACMRALIHTGWMNFRMRAMLMSVASYHLWLHWRAPGEHLARLFTDYEPGIHWPQAQMQSGTTGINTARIYNPVKQGYDQDPEGMFVRRWLPELAAVPDAFLHEPWKWEDAGRVLGRDYPFPILDHLDAAKSARRKIWAVRGSEAYRNLADRIQQKHGSRKSGIPMRGQERQRASPGGRGKGGRKASGSQTFSSGSERQLGFDLEVTDAPPRPAAGDVRKGKSAAARKKGKPE